MKRKAITFLILFVPIAMVVGLIFKQQLYDFFISPDGLSIAPSELCLNNATGAELIVEIDTFVGVKVETLLFEDQKVCAPSPNKQLVGKIRVGFADSMAFLCEKDAENAGMFTLKSIDADGKCEWLN